MTAIQKFFAFALSIAPLCAGTAQASDLLKEARVTESDARAAALARVPGGTVKSHEFEKEDGRLIWTFDIATPATGGMTEVHVDAKSGRVIAVKKESAAEEAAEAREKE